MPVAFGAESGFMTRQDQQDWQRLQDQQVRLSVVVTSRNRVDDVIRCVSSLRHLAHLPVEAIVLDDGSDPPIAPALEAHFAGRPPVALRCVRRKTSGGLIAARNELARQACGTYLLSLDDDAYLLDSRSVEAAIDVLEADPQTAAVALAQADPDGRPLNDQPAQADTPSVVRTFYGYGYVMRRDVFLHLGGYREVLHYYGEEPEFCKRLLTAGYRVVFLPEARVVHVHNPIGRSHARITAHMWRNGCYSALLNEPVWHAMVSVPARLVQFARYRWRIRGRLDRDEARQWGMRWIVREMVRDLPRLLRERRPLPGRTFARWRALGRPEPLTPPR